MWPKAQVTQHVRTTSGLVGKFKMAAKNKGFSAISFEKNGVHSFVIIVFAHFIVDSNTLGAK